MARPLALATIQRFRTHAFIVPAAMLVLAWLALPLQAAAHAQQVRTSPAPGALLDASPPYIQIEWSESVSLNFSSVKVFDRERVEQAIGAVGRPAKQDTVLKASLAKRLGPGTYTVVWRVVSATDGHLSAGSFAFRVKGSSADTTPISPDSTVAASGDEEDAGPFRWLVRAIFLAGATFLAGGTLFVVTVVQPAGRRTGLSSATLKPVLRQSFAATGAIAAALVILAMLLDLVAQVMAIKNYTFFDALGNSDAASTLISTTQYGLGWLLKLSAAAALLGIMLFVWVRRERRPPKSVFTAWHLAAIAGALLLAGEAISSHAAALHEAGAHGVGEGHAAENSFTLPLPIISDWLHLASVSLWVGGLGYMALVLFPGFRLARFPAAERREFLRWGLPRFSKLAVISVVILAVTGMYNLLLHSSDAATILSSLYGQVVIVKVAVFALLLSIGAKNLLNLGPRGRQASKEAKDAASAAAKLAGVPNTSGLPGRVRWEVAIAMLALVCASGLTLLSPPAGRATGSATSVAVPVTVTAAASDDGYKMVLAVKPSVSGDEITLTASGEASTTTPLTDVLKVLFRVTPLALDAGTTAYTATAMPSTTTGELAWSINKQVITLDGSYLITAIIERTGSADLEAAFKLDMGAAGLRLQVTRVPTPVP